MVEIVGQNPSRREANLVQISDKELRELGFTSEELFILKKNKYERQNRVHALLAQSGVPREKWPVFPETDYHLTEDVTGEVLAYRESMRLQGSLKYDSAASAEDYTSTLNVSPLDQAIELFVEDGQIHVGADDYKALQDMVGFVVSRQNTAGAVFNITSRSDKGQDAVNSKAVKDYLLQFDSRLSGDTQVIVDNIGERYPKQVDSKGVAIPETEREKYKNVVIINLSAPNLTEVERRALENKILKGGSEEAKEQITEVLVDKEDNYQKFFRNTQSTSLMPVAGVNIQVVFEFPTNDVHKSVYLHMPDTITVSHSVHRTKIPITVLGDTTVTGIGLGTKMVAGSIIKMFNRRDSFVSYIKLFVDERSTQMSKERKASLVDVQNTLSMNEMSDHMRDDIGPFNIHLISTSEYDCVYRDPPKVDSIMGCTIINTGKVYSIENLITEETISFMAKTVVYDDDISSPVSKSGSESIETGSSLLARLRA